MQSGKLSEGFSDRVFHALKADDPPAFKYLVIVYRTKLFLSAEIGKVKNKSNERSFFLDRNSLPVIACLKRARGREHRA